MTREEILKFLVGQLEELKEENVADLMKAKRIDELWEISKKLEILPLQKFCRTEHLCLNISEIPKGYHYELVFYLSQSEIFDYEIFRNPLEFEELLRKTQQDLAIQIANIMTKYTLCYCTIRELVYGKRGH